MRQDRRPLNPTATIRDGTLYIDRVQYTDAGEYTCQAINDRGQVLFDAIAQLRVISMYSESKLYSLSLFISLYNIKYIDNDSSSLQNNYKQQNITLIRGQKIAFDRFYRHVE